MSLTIKLVITVITGKVLFFGVFKDQFFTIKLILQFMQEKVFNFGVFKDQFLLKIRFHSFCRKILFWSDQSYY